MTAATARADRAVLMVAAYRDEGLTGPQVAARYGVARSTVYRALRQADVARRAWSEPARRVARARHAAREHEDRAALVARAVELARTGQWSMAAIGGEVDRSPATIKTWLTAAGVDPPRRSMTGEARASARLDARALRSRGLPLRDIAAKLGHSVPTIKDLLGEPAGTRAPARTHR